ncbi:hypothetical protein TTHERM_00443000 (macronuclear) [Tetrahymena thermophila SB210]|uniref:Uncharacterized protein n=1 Tax=Tetrahymena thermophila (strain SB210) TaxID=312017 RepID=I7M6N8_TETTS|nr:hypothetical protein TTHERM_00443000 [Tetrahymena thermophila SB210]EAR85550.1 hypothetical protein TTHERM_00443000 [Tetrahymena thermophila SB210]|eukprot:XP_001033213.1 hypothetical protein TTHERM_00443000 [Tetrahymena thermophila SB210]
MKKSANQSTYSSNKSLQNSKQQNNLNSKKPQISEFQKHDYLIDEKPNNSQQNSVLNSLKPSNNSSNHNGGQDLELLIKGKKQQDDFESKDKRQNSQKEINSYTQDHFYDRKMSINNTNKNQDQNNKMQKINQGRSSKIYKLSLEQRQLFANFRMKRDLWIRDLQEVFNKIYENFVNTLRIMKENQTNNITKEEKLKFRKHLRNQMKEIKKIAESLSDKNDDFINLYDNLPVTHYYKSNIMEMYKLLSTLLKLQMDNKQLDKIKFQKKYENKCSEPLIQEIKRSYRRVQRLKAGNRLGQVISDELEDPQIAAMISSHQKKDDSIADKPQSQLISKQIIVSVEVPGSSIISNKQQSPTKVQQIEKSKNNLNKSQKNYNSKQEIPENNDQESEDDYDPYSLEQEIDKKYLDENQNVNIDQAIKEFNKKKQDLQQMIQKFVEKVDEKDFNFNEKYLNFKEYFSKRNELIGMYLGDHQLNKFIDENEKRARQPNQSNEGDFLDDDEYQNLYKDLDPNNFQIDDRNIEALQRIIKINEEIRKNLIEEEHANKVKILDQMNVEQNQQFWTSVFEKRSAGNQLNTHSGGFFNKKQQNSKTFRQDNLQSSQSENQLLINKTSQKFNQFDKEDELKSNRDIKKQQMKLYHDYIHRNVNYNVHPSNPNLKPILTGKYDPDKIKFTRVSENQPINMVSSMSTVEKESQNKKLSIVNKTPYTNKNGDEFQKTFYQSTFYSSGSLPPASKIQNDMLIKYPQMDKDSQSQFIIPKFRGQKLTYEEEMKLISKQTRKDNPLYLNKFNARNYQNRIAPMSQKNARSYSKDSPNNQKKFMSHTNQDFSKKQLNLNEKLKDQFDPGFSISNQKYSGQVKMSPPFQIDQQVQQPTENSQNNYTQNKNKTTTQQNDENQNENRQQSQDSRQNFFTKKDYYKDEISQVFRVSQKDLLFKINGPFWKNQMNLNHLQQ